MRGTSRSEPGLAEIAAAGIEPALADPARPGTVLDLVGDVAAVVWLLGSAQGRVEELEAVHGSSLERVLERLVETPLRSFVYEAGGNVDERLLETGVRLVAEAGDRWRIPVLMPKKVALSDIAKLGYELGKKVFRPQASK
ncbi:MAG TPA: hypothetical protein VFU04_01600 [Solirubrobacterales bacterium]|nr:hypothetical protein [Solirubrobacterales bacterium]